MATLKSEILYQLGLDHRKRFKLNGFILFEDGTPESGEIRNVFQRKAVLILKMVLAVRKFWVLGEKRC